jgi:hypothetical protein
VHSLSFPAPAGIEARPWRVLVFLGCRSPGLLVRRAHRVWAAVQVIVADASRAGNGFHPERNPSRLCGRAGGEAAEELALTQRQATITIQSN